MPTATSAQDFGLALAGYGGTAGQVGPRGRNSEFGFLVTERRPGYNPSLYAGHCSERGGGSDPLRLTETVKPYAAHDHHRSDWASRWRYLVSSRSLQASSS